MVALTRRRFLGAAGVALLAGCGSRDDGLSADGVRELPPEDDVLAGLAGAEGRASAAALGGAVAAAIARQDALQLAVLWPGDDVVDPAADPAEVLVRKEQAVAAYVDALPRLADPELRVRVLQLAAGEAGHVAALRAEAGEDPVPDAFAGFGPR